MHLLPHLHLIIRLLQVIHHHHHHQHRLVQPPLLPNHVISTAPHMPDDDDIYNSNIHIRQDR